jgi:hypothetical protein
MSAYHSNSHEKITDEESSLHSNEESEDSNQSSQDSTTSTEDSHNGVEVWERIQNEAIERHEQEWAAWLQKYEQNGDSHEVASVKASVTPVPGVFAFALGYLWLVRDHVFFRFLISL